MSFQPIGFLKLNFTMYEIENTRDFKIIKSFVDHLERRYDNSGWVIFSTINYEIYNNQKDHFKNRHNHSITHSLKGMMEWKELGENDLDLEIERF